MTLPYALVYPHALFSKKILSILLLFYAIQSAHGQGIKNYQFQCVVLDAVTAQPLPAAALLIQDREGVATNVFAITDERGRASFSANLSGDSTSVVVSYLGYQNKVLPVSLSQTIIDLDTVRLAPDSVMLDEVTVVAPREVLRLQGNKMNFNLQAVPHLKYMPTDEVIAYLPFMQVDEENIKMMGEPVIILINNRPHAIYNSVAQLKLLPSHAIERIEVDLVPSARFGTNQKTMNIILKKNYFLGWNGQVGLSANRFGISPMGRASYWSKRYGMDISISNKYAVQYQDTKTEIQNYTSHSFITQDEDKERKGNSGSLYASFYYNLDSANLIDMQISLSKGRSIATSDININELSLDDNQKTEHSTYDQEAVSISKSVYLSFTHRFKKAGNEFYLLTKYQESNSDQNYHMLRQQIDEKPYYTETYYADNVNKEFTVQIDQQQHAGKVFKFLIGTKLIRRWYDGFQHRDVLTFTENNESGDLWEINYLIDQVVSSSYIETEWDIFKFKVRAGSRFEYTYQTLVRTDTSFFSWIPNVSVSRNLNEKHLIALSYYRDLFRPGFNSLIPFITSQSPYVQTSGSGNIPPQFNHKLDLQYYMNFKPVSVGLNLGYSRINNFLTYLTSTHADGSLLIQDTFSDTYQSWTLGTSANFRLFNKLRWSHFASGSYSVQQKGSLQQTLWGGYLSERVSLELPKKQRLSLSLTAFSPNLEIQGKAQSAAYPNTSFSYARFIDLAKQYPTSLSITVINPWLWKGLPGYDEQSDTDFYYYRKTYKANPFISVSLNVSLVGKQYGSKNFNRSRSINNNDLNEGEN